MRATRTSSQQRIDGCKQQLAADVLGLPSSSAAQQQLEKLAEQNRELQQQVDQLQETVKQWNAYYAEPVGGAEQCAAAKQFHRAADHQPGAG